MRIAFIVGKSSDVYRYKTTSKYAEDWLKSMSTVKKFAPSVNDDHTVPSDVAMAMYLQYKHPKDDIGLIDGTSEKMFTVREFDKWEVIIVIYDALEVFHCARGKTCLGLKNRFERALRSTKAIVYPYYDFHKYILNKSSYLNDMKRANIPVVPYISVTPTGVLKNIEVFKKRLISKGWKGVIIKPSYSGYSMGIKVIKSITTTKLSTLREHFRKLKERNFTNVLVQEFVPSFGKNYEIRTYWIDQRYAYSVATLTKAVGTGGGLPIHGFDTFVSEGGNIPDTVLRKLKRVATRVFATLPKYPLKYVLLRIDFGCCITISREGREVCKCSYFINEIEDINANMLADHTQYPVVEKTADAVYRFSRKVTKDKRLRTRLKGLKVKRPPKLSSRDVPCRR